MGTIDLRRFGGPQALAAAAAQDFLTAASEPLPGAGAFLVALSGGRIARTFCSALTEQAKARGLPQQVHFFWSDERCVPPTDPESNFLLAQRALLEPLSIPADRIHRIEGELPGDRAFGRCQAELEKLARSNTAGMPVLQIVLLGMGEDGHVASLFPGYSESELTSSEWFRCVTASKPPPQRVTMGFPVIVAAQQVWVLASGVGKAQALRQSLEPGGRTPLARVLQARAATRIYSDISEAA